MRKNLRILFINALIFGVLLLIIEVFFGGWFFSKNNLNNLGILRNVKLQYSVENLYNDSPRLISYTRDAYGLRGKTAFNNPNKIDVLTIGGSTTDQRCVDDSKTWQQFLENNLKANGTPLSVSNAGIDGQSTFGHIKNFELWFPNIPDLKPRYVLFYIGVNDFYSVRSNDNFDALDITDIKGFARVKAEIKNKSVLYNLYRKISGQLKAINADIFHQRIDITNWDYTDTGVAPKELLDQYQGEHLDAFRKRLERLVVLTNKMGAKPIFVTQPSLFYKFKDGKLWGLSKTNTLRELEHNGVDVYYLLTLTNQVIKEVAAAHDIIFVELTSLPIWEPADFYDLYHMTPAGAKKVGNEMFNQIKNKIK
jgi:lysophospholipase L1-like esterase